MHVAVFVTALGWMAVAGSESGISRVILPRQSRDAAVEALEITFGPAVTAFREADTAAFDSLPSRLMCYMEGHKVEFRDRVDTTGWTPFRTRVWNATRQIPYGQTWSYGQIAAAIGQPRACRAVGQALHRNPVPVIVPCHRVVGADASLTGFGSGLALKQALLRLESAGKPSVDLEQSAAKQTRKPLL
jgi:methylated-DNA-[protein]-cysteine S-methyltransferase